MLSSTAIWPVRRRPALLEEETDLDFLDFGGTKRHPHGTKLRAAANKKTPPRLSGRGHSEIVERETGLEPATLSLGNRSKGEK